MWSSGSKWGPYIVNSWAVRTLASCDDVVLSCFQSLRDETTLPIGDLPHDSRTKQTIVRHDRREASNTPKRRKLPDRDLPRLSPGLPLADLDRIHREVELYFLQTCVLRSRNRTVLIF